ncbi:MAG: hypothetical protein K1X94_20545 [Sandaracinaceae bacterium]|nr:hypothetical protein [Sandaracinaceae bacterium]
MSHTRDAAQIAYLDEMRDWVTNTQARVVRGDTSFVPTLRTRLRKQAALEAAVGDHAAVPALLSRAAECGVTLLRCAAAPGAKVRFSLGGQSISGTAAVSPDQADRVVWIETFWFTHLVDDPRLRAELLALPLELALSDRVQEPRGARGARECIVRCA